VIDENILAVINSLGRVIELRDSYTQGHSTRVATYARQIASSLGLDDKQMERIYLAGLLHDVGKIGIPDAVLLKPGKLTPEEYEIVKLHSTLSAKIVAGMGNFEDIVAIVRHHHEQPCGKGYPDGLVADQIPLGSRIIAVADVFDSLRSERVYRKALSLEVIQQVMSEEVLQGKLDKEITSLGLQIISQTGTVVTTKESLFPDLDYQRQAFFYRDKLTGLGNREALIFLLKRASVTTLPTSLLHIDVLNFRHYNKSWGVLAGDELLQKIGLHLIHLTRPKWPLELIENTLYSFRTVADSFCILYFGYSTDYTLDKISKMITLIEEEYAIKFEITLILEHSKISPNFEFEIGYLL